MFCSYCGNQIADDARFCSYCGKGVVGITKFQTVPTVNQPAGEEISPEQPDEAAVQSEPLKENYTEQVSEAGVQEEQPVFAEQSVKQDIEQPTGQTEEQPIEQTTEQLIENPVEQPVSADIAQISGLIEQTAPEDNSVSLEQPEFNVSQVHSPEQQAEFAVLQMKAPEQQTEFAAPQMQAPEQQAVFTAPQKQEPERKYTLTHLLMCLASTAIFAIAAGVFAGLYFAGL